MRAQRPFVALQIAHVQERLAAGAIDLAEEDLSIACAFTKERVSSNLKNYESTISKH